MQSQYPTHMRFTLDPADSWSHILSIGLAVIGLGMLYFIVTMWALTTKNVLFNTLLCGHNIWHTLGVALGGTVIVAFFLWWFMPYIQSFFDNILPHYGGPAGRDLRDPEFDEDVDRDRKGRGRWTKTRLGDLESSW